MNSQIFQQDIEQEYEDCLIELLHFEEVLARLESKKKRLEEKSKCLHENIIEQTLITSTEYKCEDCGHSILT